MTRTAAQKHNKKAAGQKSKTVAAEPVAQPPKQEKAAKKQKKAGKKQAKVVEAPVVEEADDFLNIESFINAQDGPEESDNENVCSPRQFV
jgi:hypothetical protein